MSYELKMEQKNLQQISSQYAVLSTEIVEAEREIAALEGQRDALLAPLSEKRKRHGELKTILDFLQQNLKEEQSEEVSPTPDIPQNNRQVQPVNPKAENSLPKAEVK